MKKKLFVSNLDFEVTADQLRDIFNEVGGASSLTIAQDRETKRSKGFAFVEMESEEAALDAIDKLTGKLVNGRPIKVVEDRGKGSVGDGEERRREYLPPIQRTVLFRRRRKLDPFTADPTKAIDYKEVAILGKFLSERGRLLSRRVTGLSAYNQRKISKAIKRAQNAGLMPFSRV